MIPFVHYSNPSGSLPSGSYRLDALDEIAIKFIVDPQLNDKVVIRPDGMITLQAIGDIRAAGLTPKNSGERSANSSWLPAYSVQTKPEKVKNYKLVTVHVISFLQKLRKLVESLTTLSGGQQAAILVNPDGTVDFPLLKERVCSRVHDYPG